MDPISRVIYRNDTLTLSNRVYRNAFELGNGFWVSYEKQLKLNCTPKRIRETGKNATLSFVDNIGVGLCTDRDLRDSQLSQLMKPSRKTKT